MRVNIDGSTKMFSYRLHKHAGSSAFDPVDPVLVLVDCAVVADEEDVAAVEEDVVDAAEAAGTSGTVTVLQTVLSAGPLAATENSAGMVTHT